MANEVEIVVTGKNQSNAALASATKGVKDYSTEVEKASLKVQAARDAEADAAEKVRIAEAKLNELRDSGNAKGSQLIDAEHRLEVARRKAAAASRDAATAATNLDRAERAAADAAREAAEEHDELGEAIDEVSKRAQSGGRGVGLAWLGTLASMPVAGAAAAASLGVVGTAFIGLGAVAVSENEDVKASVIGLGRTIKEDLAEDAAPLADAYMQATSTIGAGFERLRPQMRNAFGDSVPLVDSLTQGVVGFAENAMPGMVRSVQRAEPVFDGLQTFLKDTGTGVSLMLTEMSEHSEEAGQGMEHLGALIKGTLPEAGGIIGNLTDMWAEHGDEVVDAVTRIVGVLNDMSGGALPVLGDALGVALGLLDHVLDVIEPMSGELGTLIGMWLTMSTVMKGIGAARSVISSVGDSITSLGDKTTGTTRKMGLLKAGAIGLALGIASILQESQALNVQVDAMTTGLDRFADSGKVSGEAARILGQDLQQIKDAFSVADDNLLEQITDGVGDLVGMESGLDVAKERLDGLDQSLVRLAETAGRSEAFRALQQIAQQTGISIEDLRGKLPEFNGYLEETAGSFEATGQATDYARQALDSYLEATQAATDPVFALNQALRQVDEAQKSYNDAVRQYGENSPQAREASFALAEAVSKAEQAALNGDLSFEEFESRLQAWVAQGAITAKQADDIRGRVNRLRGSAEDYRGNYGANFHANTDGARRKLGVIIRMINGIPRTVTTTHNVVTHFSSTGTRIGTQNAAGEWYQGGGGLASGGIYGAGHAQEGGPRGNMVLVGEQGPELVNLPTGSMVKPAGETRQMLRGGGAPPVNVIISVPASAGAFIRALMEDMRENVRVEYGGDVNEALGQR